MYYVTKCLCHYINIFIVLDQYRRTNKAHGVFKKRSNNYYIIASTSHVDTERTITWRKNEETFLRW